MSDFRLQVDVRPVIERIRQISRVQPAQAWWRFGRQVLQVHRAHRRRQGYAVPGSHARRFTLARHQEDRQHGLYERHVRQIFWKI